MKYIYILMAVLFLFGIYMLIFNRPLYCKIAMFGQLNSVPAFCLKDAVKDILKNGH